MLERSVFVRCLLVDFSKAFDVVDHTDLLAKLSQIGLPDRYKLFRSLQNPQHCLHSILPPTKPLNHDLRPKGHIIRSPTTPQSCINDLSFPFSVLVLLTLVVLSFLIIFILCVCFCVLSSLHYCI